MQSQGCRPGPTLFGGGTEFLSRTKDGLSGGQERKLRTEGKFEYSSDSVAEYFLDILILVDLSDRQYLPPISQKNDDGNVSIFC